MQGHLIDLIPPTISVYEFPNDHNGYNRFNPMPTNIEVEAFRGLKECALTMNNWVTEYKLKMKTSKTEFIRFGSKTHLTKCKTKTTSINRGEIKSEENQRT